MKTSHTLNNEIRCCKKSRFYALPGIQNLVILPPKIIFFTGKSQILIGRRKSNLSYKGLIYIIIN